MYKKIGLIIIILDLIIGLYFFLYKGYTDGMVVLITTSHVVIATLIVGILSCILKRTMQIGYLLIANFLFLPIVFWGCANIGYFFMKRQKSIHNITYNFIYRDHPHELTLYSKKSYGTLSARFVLHKSTNDKSGIIFFGSYYKECENYYYLVPDSSCLHDIRRHKINYDKDYLYCDTIILRNDTLTGLYSSPICIKEKNIFDW